MGVVHPLDCSEQPENRILVGAQCGHTPRRIWSATDLINRTGIDLCADAVGRVTSQYLSSRYDGDGFRALYTKCLGMGPIEDQPFLLLQLLLPLLLLVNIYNVPGYNSIHSTTQKESSNNAGQRKGYVMERLIKFHLCPKRSAYIKPPRTLNHRVAIIVAL